MTVIATVICNQGIIQASDSNLTSSTGPVYERVWREPSWKFRRPASLDELAAFVRLELETINTLFTSSDYPTPYVGGDIQIEKIPAPPGTIDL